MERVRGRGVGDGGKGGDLDEREDVILPGEQ